MTDTTTTSAATTRAPAPAARIHPRSWADVAVILVLGVIGMVGFGSAFDSPSYLIAGGGGLLVGAGAIILCLVLRFNLVLTLATSIVLWYLIGPAVAIPGEALLRVLPSLKSLADLSIGSVNGWSDLLTLRPPVSLPEYVNAVPYAAGAVVSLISVGLVLFWLPRRRRTAFRSVLVLLPPLALYLSSVLLGTDSPYFAAARGIGFAAIALVWIGWRRRDGVALAVGGGGALVARKLVGAGVIVLVAVTIGAVVGTTLAPAQSSRFVLRDVVQPPFEPLTYATPLAGFRHYTKTLAKTDLFTVKGLRSGDVLRIASLDTYNGENWGVAGAQQASDASGSFLLVGRSIPKAPATPGSTPSKISVTVDKYSDVWMPTTGVANKISFTGPAATSDLESVRYNDTTGTAVLTTGLKQGMTYTISDRIAAAPDDRSLAKATIARFAPSTVSHTPDPVVAKAKELTESAKTPIAKLRAIQQWLVNTGYFSHGTFSDQVPSRAGHGADRMYDMVTLPTMVGDQEQYASLFALMARSLNYPVRVVMGFDPKVTSDSGDAVQVTGSSVTAWAEVAFDRVGWVPFFPSPKNPDVPQSQVPKPQTEPQPQVRQPPRTNSDPDDLVTPVQVSKTKDKKSSLFDLPAWAIYLIAGVLLVAVVVFLPMLIIAALKRRRMRRRRAGPGDRSAAGAWNELVDRYSELGYAIPTHLTRTHVAAGIGAQVRGEAPALSSLASATDAAVFSGKNISSERSEQLWVQSLAAVDVGAAPLGRRRRIASRYRIRSAQRWLHRVGESAAAQVPTRSTKS